MITNEKRHHIYKLATDGDSRERTYANKFLDSEFPAYEEFWQRYIIRLTNRPTDIHFKDVAALSAVGCGDKEIQVAQLHYSVLVHLAAAWNMKQMATVDRQELSWTFFSLVSAQDVAFELLGRVLLPKNYTTFDWKDSKRASEDYIKKEKMTFPTEFKNVRVYRNNLAHGHVSPAEDRNVLLFPKIGTESRFSDWRLVTTGDYAIADFETGKLIIDTAWKTTVEYLQNKWMNELLKYPAVASLAIPLKPLSGLSIAINITASAQSPTLGTTRPYVIPPDFGKNHEH